jgi:general secretion pathway protein D
MKTKFNSKVVLMGLLSLVLVNPTQAQFRKYKKATNFNVDKKKDASSSPPPIVDNDKTQNNDNTFGARRMENPLVGSQKESKFVNLNPETAFGPEVITSFDFPETDLMELTRHMQKLTGINLILDKDVKGKVSITAPTPITVGDAWKAYLAALNMAGYTLVKAGAFYKIINSRDVRYTPTKIYTGAYTPDTESHVMKIIALKNVDASEIARNFRPFMSRYGRIIDLKQTNTIIISDTGTNIHRLEKLIKFLDVPGYEESLQIIPVRNSSAQEIAKLLDTILKGGSSGGGSRTAARSKTTTATKGSNISNIIAEPRTNSIIAMANAEGARELRELIKKLDVERVSSNSGRIHVHYLNYGDSEELAKTLSTLVSNARSAGGAAGGANNRRFVSTRSTGDTIFTSEVKVTADKNNNALVVTASPTDWLTLKNVINKLDIPRDQVYVEGMIIETSIQRIRAAGFEYLGAYGAGNAQRAGFVTPGSGFVDLLSGNPTSINGFFLGSGGPEQSPRTFNIGGQSVKVNSVNALLKAVASNTNTNVLATPQILAMDNTEAEFEVGSTIPILETTTATNGTTTNSVSNQEAKLSLKITPQINKVTRFVKLKINQSINDFVGETNTTTGGAATNTRSAVTEVMIRDRDTLAMGGLLRDREEVSFNKVPVLGDIPFLGWLFKNKSKTVTKVNLLFFLTPKIISPYEKEASKNTIETISKRNEHIKTILDKDQDDYHKDTMTKLQKKMDKQSTGPLYDQSHVDRYKKVNESSQGMGGGR